jgi:hypothetical protein
MRPDDPLWDFVFDVGRDGDCTDVDVVTVVEPLEGRRPGRALNSKSFSTSLIQHISRVFIPSEVANPWDDSNFFFSPKTL